MSEHDRGAYTPDLEEPIAFDPRRSGERRPLPMALIASALILIGLIGGVLLVYRGGARRADQGPRPVGEPVMAVKTAPTTPPVRQAQTADEDADVYAERQVAAAPPAPAASAGGNVAGPTGPAPTFAPPPEQPAPRPAPRPSAVAALAPPKAPPATAALHAPPSGRELDEAEVAAAGGGAPRAPASAPAKLATASPPESIPSSVFTAAQSRSSAEPAGAVESADPTGVVVQIGAFSSMALADKGYAGVASAMAGRMEGKSKHVQPLPKGGSTLYRTWIAGFHTRLEAEAFCESLKAHAFNCIVKG